MLTLITDVTPIMITKNVQNSCVVHAHILRHFYIQLPTLVLIGKKQNCDLETITT